MGSKIKVTGFQSSSGHGPRSPWIHWTIHRWGPCSFWFCCKILTRSFKGKRKHTVQGMKAWISNLQICIRYVSLLFCFFGWTTHTFQVVFGLTWIHLKSQEKITLERFTHLLGKPQVSFLHVTHFQWGMQDLLLEAVRLAFGFDSFHTNSSQVNISQTCFEGFPNILPALVHFG